MAGWCVRRIVSYSSWLRRLRSNLQGTGITIPPFDFLKSGKDLSRSSLIRLAIHQPQDHAQHHADDERGHQRKVEGEARPLDCDVAGKPTEPEPADQRPGDSGDEQDQSEDDKRARHLITSISLAFGRPMPGPGTAWPPLAARYGPRSAARLAYEFHAGKPAFRL